jgi:hypothetical protein
VRRPAALKALDIAAIERLLTPVDANLGTARVDILDRDARVVFAFRAEGETPPLQRSRADLEIVTRALAGTSDEYGDRFSTLVVGEEGPLIATAGAVRDADDATVGAVLVMTPLPRALSESASQHGAVLTAYSGSGGVPLATTAGDAPRRLPRDLARLRPASELPVASSYRLGGRAMREQLGALVIRHRPVAWIGAALPDRSARARTRVENAVGVAAIVAALVLVTLAATRRRSRSAS